MVCANGALRTECMFAYFTFSCAGDTLQASTLNYLASQDRSMSTMRIATTFEGV